MLGKMYVSALLNSGGVSLLLQHGKVAHLFRGPEIPVWKFVEEFVKSYGKLPTEQTIYTHTQEDLTEANEPAEYYLDLMVLRHTEHEVKRAIKEAADLLTEKNKDPHASLARLGQVVMELALQKAGGSITDFRDAYELVIPAYVQQYQTGGDHKLKMGWATLDNMTGGIGTGDLVSIIGRPQRGKTQCMLYSCYAGWQASQFLAKEAEMNGDDPGQYLNGASRLFVSMEMMNLPVENRLAAMHAHVPAEHLKLAALTTTNFKKLKDSLIEVKGYGAPFWIVDGSQFPLVEDVYILAKHLRPGAIYIDSAYLMKHPRETDRYRRVAENVDLLKQQLCPLAPTVTSWQFARPRKGAKQTTKQDMDDIGYSDAIAQGSSVVMGLFEEESIETVNQKRMDILKGRYGETGHFFVNWDWFKMDFSECVEESISELQYI